MPRTYAYVQTETCGYGHTRAVLPGAVAFGSEPVSRCGDYCAWTAGKWETLAIIDADELIGYRYRAALSVAELLGWI